MSRPSKLTISYGSKPSRIQRWRGFEGQWARVEDEHTKMLASFENARQLWERCGQDVDDRRLVCTATFTASVTFLRHLGIPEFAYKRLHELALALSEANAGHKAELLDRAKVHPGTFSPVDLIYQGAAQTSVDLLTGAGVPVGEARRRVARQLMLKKVKGFSVPTLNKLGTRLAGRGARQDRAYDYYQMTKEFAEAAIRQRGRQHPISEDLASIMVKAVINKAISEDLVQKRYSA
jgi:hypothetical protein